MIMTHEKFAGFTAKPIADTKTNIGGLFSLSVDSVDEHGQRPSGWWHLTQRDAGLWLYATAYLGGF